MGTVFDIPSLCRAVVDYAKLHLWGSYDANLKMLTFLAGNDLKHIKVDANHTNTVYTNQDVSDMFGELLEKLDKMPTYLTLNNYLLSYPVYEG